MGGNRKSEFMNDEKLICDGIDHQLYPMVEVFLSELDVRCVILLEKNILN